MARSRLRPRTTIAHAVGTRLKSTLLMSACLGLTAACGGLEADADIERDVPEVETAEAAVAVGYVNYTSVNQDVYWTCVGTPAQCPAGSGHTITPMAQGMTAACNAAIADANAQGATLDPELTYVSRGAPYLNNNYLPPNGTGPTANYAYCPVTATRHTAALNISAGNKALSLRLTCPADTNVDFYPRGCRCSGPSAGGYATCPNTTPLCERVHPGATTRRYTWLPYRSTNAQCILWCDAQSHVVGDTCKFGPSTSRSSVIKTY
jgi:hypothetical protein